MRRYRLTWPVRETALPRGAALWRGGLP